MIFKLFAILATVAVVHGFKSMRSFQVNGVIYNETMEQPWFRHRHEVHLPVPLAMINESDWGIHMLPDDDVYMEHEYTDEEKKYLPCRNVTCICPFYRGKMVGRKCVLPNGKRLKKAIRKEIRSLTDDERHQIETAFDRMKMSGEYDRLGLVHKYSGVHEGPGFFTWHREFLKRAEFLLRRYLPEGSALGIPYWDSSLESEVPNPAESIYFSPLFIGTTGKDDFVDSGPYAHWKTIEGTRHVIRHVGQKDSGEVLSRARIDFVLNLTNINHVMAAVVPLETCPLVIMDERLFEYSHDYVHDFINGDMKESYSSSSEISFYFHHAMVDHIWEMWRQKAQTREQRVHDYPPSIGSCYTERHFIDADMTELDPYTNRDGLSNDYTDHLYSYAERPTCRSKDDECGSKYLFCYTGAGIPGCMSKIRDFGDCSGFDGFSICFDGFCDEKNKCQRYLTGGRTPVAM